MESRSHPTPRYRIVAAEAHSWTTLLLADDAGTRFLYNLDTRALTAIDDERASRLLTARVYRPWRGSRSAVPLDRLPVAGSPTTVPRVDTGLLVDGGQGASDAAGQ